MNRRSFVTICFWHLSEKRELLHLYVKLSGFVKNTSRSRSLANMLKMKHLADKGGKSPLAKEILPVKEKET